MASNQKAVKAGYKQTEVGVIPEDWDVFSFNEIFNITSGVGFKKSEYSQDGIKLVRIDNVSYGLIKWDSIAYLPEKYSEYYSDIMLKEGDILLALNRPITNGQLKIALLGEDDVPAILYQRVGRIQKKNLSMNMLYAYYMLTTHIKSFVEGSSVGTDQPFISTVQLKKLLLPFPPTKKEQTAIAKALSDTDARITTLNALIHKKEQIKQGAMQQLLTGKVRLQGFGEGVGFKQTELGEIPEDWAISTVKEVSLIPMQNGLFLDPSRRGKGIKIVNVGDLYKAAPIDIEALEAFEATAVEKSTYAVEDGDLFFTRSSIVPSGIAFCNICEFDDDRQLVFDSHLIKVRVDINIMYPRFAYLVLLSNMARQHLISNAKTATMTTIDQGAINSCPVLIPELDEQIAIANALASIDTDIQTLKQRLAKTKALKQGMMHELLTGKTRLVPDAALAEESTSE